MDKIKAREFLLEIKEAFDNLKIKFWLGYGTCLGAVREGRFIPYDWDLDLQMLARDFSPKIRKVLGEIASFRLITIWPGRPGGPLLQRPRIHVHITLRYYVVPKDIYISFLQRNWWQTAVLPGRLLRDDYWVDFLDTKFRVPNPPEEYLERIYGKNWRIPFDPHKTKKRWTKHWRLIPPATFAKYAQWIEQHPKEF